MILNTFSFTSIRLPVPEISSKNNNFLSRTRLNSRLKLGKFRTATTWSTTIPCQQANDEEVRSAKLSPSKCFLVYFDTTSGSRDIVA